MSTPPADTFPDSAPQPEAPQPEAQPPPGRRKRPPAWGILLFLALLAGVVLLNQWITTSGPDIPWYDGTLESALKRADTTGERVFLYLYELGDPLHARNERQIFSQRWAREPLATAICVRVAIEPGNPLRLRYDLRDSPKMLLLKASGEVMTEVDDMIDERQFMTFIGRPLLDHHRQRQAAP